MWRGSGVASRTGAVVEVEPGVGVTVAEVVAGFGDAVMIDLQVVGFRAGEGAVAVIGSGLGALTRDLIEGGAAPAALGDRLDLPAGQAPGDEVADRAGHHAVVVLPARRFGL